MVDYIQGSQLFDQMPLHGRLVQPASVIVSFNLATQRDGSPGLSCARCYTGEKGDSVLLHVSPALQR
jgi:hypothetical protein